MFRGRAWIFAGSPAVVEATAHHVDGIGIAARSRAPKPLEGLNGIPGKRCPLEQHAAVAQLRLWYTFESGDEHPVSGTARILRKQRLKPRRTHLTQQRYDRRGVHAGRTLEPIAGGADQRAAPGRQRVVLRDAD